MSECFSENDLISHNQSGFKPGDLCINLLSRITHGNFINLLMKAYFLIYGKPLIRFGFINEGLLHKLKENSMSGKLLNNLKDFLYQWKQRILLNGQYYSWAAIEAGVPQGSILGPLLFLIYINDLSDDLASNAKLFADDTSSS